MKEQEWIALIAPIAQEAVREIGGYLTSVLIAQTCQETGYGITDLSQKGIYNTVGMKEDLLNSTWESNYWHGDVFSKLTPEWDNGEKHYITDVFRVYKSYKDGLCDYLQFMRDARYSKGGQYKYRDVLDIKDPAELIRQVRLRGYCTDPTYDTSIMWIISKHNLTQYDTAKEKKMSYNSIAEAAAALGVTIIDIIDENEWQVPAHNSNSHEYSALHYLGVNGDNPYLYGGGYGGHFYVNKKGDAYQAALPTDKVWHVAANAKNGYHYIHDYARNYNTVGTECATFTASGYDNENEPWYYTTETQVTAAKLQAAILTVLGIPFDHLLMHGEITNKHCPAPYIDYPGQGTNWTWERFKAEVKGYMDVLAGTAADYESMTPERKLIAEGQRQSINFTGHYIDVDGIKGKETLKNMVRCLQRAMVLDYGIDLDVDGILGPKTKAALEGHYIEIGERQYLVTAVEICMYCHGLDPNGVEWPGIFGNGLKAAVGAEYLAAEDIIRLFE